MMDHSHWLVIICILVISYLLCLALLIAGLRISYKVRREQLAICFGVILIVVGLPFLIFWLFCGIVFRYDSGVSQHNSYFEIDNGVGESLNVKQLMDEFQDVTACLCVIAIIPNASLIAFLVTFEINFHSRLWIIFALINLVYYYLFALILHSVAGVLQFKGNKKRQCGFVLLIICLLPLQGSLIAVIMNILGPLLHFLVLLRLYHFLMMNLLGEHIIRRLTKSKHENLLIDEYQKYIKCKDLFEKERELILMEYIYETNIISIIKHYLDDLELNDEEGISFVIKMLNGNYVKDCDVIEDMFDVDLDMVEEYVHLRQSSEVI
eukprot:358859_1